MNILILIGLAILVFFLIVFIVKAIIMKKRIVKHFKQGNVIVFGHKGKGKDLVFQSVINARKNKYWSNIDYGGNRKDFVLKNFDLKNDYRNFIEDKVNVVNKEDYPYEEEDVYISDGGIVLPSQYDGILSKVYPSYPVAFALSRHLWHNNFHINTQALGRVWIKLREQADYYVQACGVLKLPFILLVKVRCYDKYSSAEQSLLPYEKGFINLNKYDKALINQYYATNGEIKEGWIIVPKRTIKYDTRAYHKIIFGYPFASGSRGGDNGGEQLPLDNSPNDA